MLCLHIRGTFLHLQPWSLPPTGFGKLGSAELPSEDAVSCLLLHSQDHLLCCCLHRSHVRHPSHNPWRSGCIDKYGAGRDTKVLI